MTMEAVHTKSSAERDSAGLDKSHLSLQTPPPHVYQLEHGIKTSDLRSSPRPLDNDPEPSMEEAEDTDAVAAGQYQPEQAQGKACDETPANDVFPATSLFTTQPETTNNQLEVSHTSIHTSAPSANDTYGHQIDGRSALSLRTSDAGADDFSLADAATSLIESEGPRIQAFAKLEFDDGQFYMNTYAVELGRDIRAARKALQYDYQANQVQERPPSMQSRHRSNSSMDGNQGPQLLRRSERNKTASSVLSESGGIWNFVPYEVEGARRPKSRKTRSEGSSSRISRNNSLLQREPQSQQEYSNEAPAKLSTHGSQPVNPSALMPSPEECPLIPIHPPTTTEVANTGHRGISRRHVRIAYNFDRRLFEMEVKGRNGAFVDEQFHAIGEMAELRSGSYIQIGGVGIRFLLPNVAIGDTGAEGTQGSEAQSAMSFDFEDGRGEGIVMTATTESDSSEIDEGARSPERVSSQGIEVSSQSDADSDEGNQGEDEDEEEGDGAEAKTIRRKVAQSSRKTTRKSKKNVEPEPSVKVNSKLKLKSGLKPIAVGKELKPMKDQSTQELQEEAIRALDLGIPLSMIPPRRKGPGRPPKNGFMSKREEASLKKQAKEAAKAQAATNGMVDLDAIKQSLDLAALEKRKYTKRKKNDVPADDGEIRESIEGSEPPALSHTAAGSVPKPPKEKKPKPPKSPSPFIDESTLTPEQLAKPQQSYVVLIHEALTNSPTGQMSLPQIYKAIERRYPYFKFKVQTVGWQSSIRHNLSQHPAFYKVEREGKGWMWGLVPDVSIEKERRPRRPSPPPMAQSSFYPPAPHMFPPPFPYSGMPGPPASGGQAGQGQLMYTPLPPTGFKSSAVVRGPNGLPLPIAQGNTSTTYQSPYTPAPQSASGQRPENGDQSQAFGAQASSEQSVGAAKVANLQDSSAEGLNLSTDQSFQQSRVPLSSSQPLNLHQQPASPLPASISHEAYSRKTLDIVDRFKAIMIESLSNTPKAEEIVTRAINRTLGIQPSKSQQTEYPEEQAIMHALRNMLDQIRERDQQEQMERERWEKEQRTAASAAGSQRDVSSIDAEQASQAQGQQGAFASDPVPKAVSPSPKVAQSMKRERTASPTAPSPSPVTAPQSAHQSRPQTAPDVEDSTKMVPASASSTKPLAEAEKDQLLSLLQQLGQSSPAGPALTTEQPSNGTLTGDLSRDRPDSSVGEADRGLKRKYSDQVRATEEPEDGESSQKYGMGEMEGARVKRVAV